MTGRPAPSNVEGRHGPFGPLWGYVTVTQHKQTWWARFLDMTNYTIDIEWSGGTERLELKNEERTLIVDLLKAITAELDEGKPPDLKAVFSVILADKTW